MDWKRILILYWHVCAGVMVPRLDPDKQSAASASRIGPRSAAPLAIAGSESALPASPGPDGLAKTTVRKGFCKGFKNLLLRRDWSSGVEKAEDDLTCSDPPFLNTSANAGLRNYEARACNVFVGQALTCKTHGDQGLVNTMRLFKICDSLKHRTGPLARG